MSTEGLVPDKSKPSNIYKASNKHLNVSNLISTWITHDVHMCKRSMWLCTNPLPCLVVASTFLLFPALQCSTAPQSSIFNLNPCLLIPALSEPCQSQVSTRHSG